MPCLGSWYDNYPVAAAIQDSIRYGETASGLAKLQCGLLFLSSLTIYVIREPVLIPF